MTIITDFNATSNKRCSLVAPSGKLDCGVDVPGKRATLPATREFEVNDFFINLEVAFSQETDLLRCIIAILAGHEHRYINEAE